MLKTIFLAFCLILSSFSFAQKKIIAVIGSSTAAGTGASPIDSSWVNIIKKYYKSLGLIDTLYNLAVGGTTTYSGMPTGFIHPSGRPGYDAGSNVTKALSLKADIVLVSFPSNDIADGYTLGEMLFNLRTIYNTVTAAHKICYITTTQPRNFPNITKAQQLMQKQVRDSVLAEFPLYSLNFYNPIVGPDSLSINSKYSFGDDIHVNDQGHQLLYQVVKKNVLLSLNPLAVSLTDFNAYPEQNSVLLRWTLVNDHGTVPYYSEVQRSADGSSFTSLDQEKGQENDLSDQYSWTDQDPLPGRSFYRLRIEEAGQESFSRTLSLVIREKELAIRKIYIAGNSSLTAELGLLKDDHLMVTIVNTAGMVIRQGSFDVHQPLANISLPVANLARGQYFLKIATANGQSVTRPFLKF